MTKSRPAIYLLHFSRPIKHAKHYLGFVNDGAKLDDRLHEHRTGRGARLTQVCAELGIEMILARVWTEDCSRTKERKMKNGKNTPRLCPLCQK